MPLTCYLCGEALSGEHNCRNAHGQFILAADGRTPVPCPDLFEWARWMEREGQGLRKVAVTSVGAYVVSTVFTGMECAPFPPPDGSALLFETALFAAAAPGMSWEFIEIVGRTSSWTQAEGMHEEACAEVVKHCVN